MEHKINFLSLGDAKKFKREYSFHIKMAIGRLASMERNDSMRSLVLGSGLLFASGAAVGNSYEYTHCYRLIKTGILLPTCGAWLSNLYQGFMISILNPWLNFLRSCAGEKARMFLLY